MPLVIKVVLEQHLASVSSIFGSLANATFSVLTAGAGGICVDAMLASTTVLSAASLKSRELLQMTRKRLQ